jgi:hypothetical protein
MAMVAVLAGCSALRANAPAAPTAVVAATPVTPTATSSPAPQVDNGCGQSDLMPFDTGPSPTNVQFGTGSPIVIRDAGAAVNEDDARNALPDFLEPHFVPSDLALQLMLLLSAESTGAHVETFYAARPIGPGQTNEDFFSQRAIIVSQSPTRGQTGAFVRQTVGDAAFEEHARIVLVGAYGAALVHDGALPNGVRTYHLFWSDGKSDFVIAATTTPAELVDVARSMSCRG